MEPDGASPVYSAFLSGIVPGTRHTPRDSNRISDISSFAGSRFEELGEDDCTRILGIATGSDILRSLINKTQTLRTFGQRRESNKAVQEIQVNPLIGTVFTLLLRLRKIRFGFRNQVIVSDRN